MAYIYVYSRPNGIPFYVGRGHGERSSNLVARTKWFKNVVKKYGASNLKLHRIDSLTEAESCELEQFLISEIGRRCDGGPLVNLSKGGEHGTFGCVAWNKGKAVPSEVREKIRQSHLGVPRPPEVVAKIAAANKGKKRSAKAKRNISVACAGRKITCATKAKMALGHAGVPLSEEHRFAIKSALKQAYVQRPELKQKISEAKKRYWAKIKAAKK